ncbi:MAG: PD-(D/E)XK nuclease family protein, partial [Prevotella sp.]|nr:PD-(D/E)XK nuclease family protein [Prevotella sp.]
GKQSEMSRFMLQLMSQEEFRHIRQKTLVAPVATPKTKTEITADEAKTLPFEAEMLSPTDFGRYLRCPRQFYYSKVAAIPQPDQDEDSLDNRLFGNVFHKAAQLLYDGLSQDGSIKKDDIAAVLKDPRRIENIVSEAFREEKAVINNRISPLHHAVITDYLRRLLTIDQKLAPFSIIGNEHRVRAQYSVDGRKIAIGGIIDRLDLVTDSNGERRIRVVDYKTGSQPQQTVASVEEIFDPACITKKHSDYFLQTMLYATIVSQNHEGKYPSLPVAPALIFIQHTAGDDYDPTLVVNHQKISDIRACQPTFGEHLQGLLSDILNPENPFAPTDEQKRCTYCPYKKICKS